MCLSVFFKTNWVKVMLGLFPCKKLVKILARETIESIEYC